MKSLPLDRFFVYALLDPRKPGRFEYDVEGRKVVFKYEPFYVGKGTGKRPYAHAQQARRSTRITSRKDNLIRKLQAAELEPIVRQGKQALGELAAYSYERELVSAIGRVDLKTGPLLNRDNGGGGLHFQKMTKKQFAKYRKTSAEYSKEWWANLSGTELDAYKCKLSAGNLRRWSRLTEEERSAKLQKTMQTRAAFSEERRQLHLDRMREGIQDWYSDNPERVAEMRRKQNTSKGDYPLVQCPKCCGVGKGGNMTRGHFDNCNTERYSNKPWLLPRKYKYQEVPKSLIGKRGSEVPSKWRFLWA